MAQLIQTIMMSALCVGNVSKPVLPSAPGRKEAAVVVVASFVETVKSKKDY